MVNMSNKLFLAIIITFVIIACIAVLIAVNFMGWGKALAGFGGPFAAGLYKVFAMFPQWVLNGGWPTMIAGIAIIGALMFAAGYLFEKKEIIARITGSNTSETQMKPYNAQVQPEDAETQATAKTGVKA